DRSGPALEVRQPALAIAGLGRAREARVRLARIGRLLLDARAEALRRLVRRIDEPLGAGARPDREDDRRPITGTDDHVRGAGRAVDEVPRAERPLLALDHERALAGQDEEVLLLVLAVVHGHRHPGLEDVQVDAELLELRLVLEGAVETEFVLVPASVAR